MEQEKTVEWTVCRVCGFKPLVSIMSLGDLYVSDFVSPGDKAPEKIPLDLVLCNTADGGCGLLQLKHTFPHEMLYRNYWYRSGMNDTMTKELQGITRKVESLVSAKAGDRVIDIGANDGTLLRGYSDPGLIRVGFEPAKNLATYNNEGTTKIINNFFNFAEWQKEFGDAKAKAVTAIAMFYDLEYPNAFIADVAKCLDEDGVFIIQMSYLPLMLTENAFDNICHEHLEYYSLLSIEVLLKRHQLEVFDVELNDVNGGSFRIYIKHQGLGKKIKIPVGANIRVESLREYEKALGLNDRAVYDAFSSRIEALKKQTVDFVKEAVAKGKKVYVYGASTKGNTLLQYYGLDHTLITAAAERNKDKWGKLTIGTNIPVISEEQARSEKPDYFLVLPWHFLPEFKEREKDFFAQGGKFIVPLPKFEII